MRVITIAFQFEAFSKKAGLDASLKGVILRFFRLTAFPVLAPLPWLALFLFCLNFSILPAAAQSNNAAAYTWSTLAGYSGTGSADGVGGAAQFWLPDGVATDTAGNVYVADSYNDTIREITLAGVVTTIAGLAGNPGNADGVNGAARFNDPEDVAVDTNGNVYVADSINFTIRKITPSGTNWVVTTIAGQPPYMDQYGNLIGGSADGIGTNASFGGTEGGIEGIAVGPLGNLFVADTGNNIIRKITHSGANWIVKTIAGTAGVYGDANGTNGAAQFDEPWGIAVDGGAMYIWQIVRPQRFGSLPNREPTGL